MSEEANKKELLYHFINIELASYSEMQKRLNYIVIAEMVLSAILITLALGAISADQAVSIAGFKFIIKPWLPLLGGALTVAVLFQYGANLFHQRYLVYNSLDNLYKALEGYKDIRESINLRSRYLVIPSVMGTLIGSFRELPDNWLGKAYRPMPVATLLTFILVPVAAQILTAYKTISIVGWKWWVVILFAVSLLITISTIIAEIYAQLRLNR